LSKSEKLKIYGNDYQTRDGTCLRDYVHVVDLCEAHLLALKKMNAGVKNEVFNLGTDKGTTLLELIKSVEKVTGKKVEYEMCNRRPGDPARLVASNKKAKDVLGWSPRYNLNDIIESAWKWEVSLQK
jgi:UDP-glucose 4-epimerase